MIDFENYPTYNKLKFIIGEENIALKYVPNFKKLNVKFKLRPSDKNASCIIGQYNDNLYVKDFGDGLHPKARHLYEFLIESYNLTHLGIIKMIMSDFNISSKNVEDVKFDLNYSDKPSSFKKSFTYIDVIKRDWNEKDEEYWQQYYISINKLETKNIYPISFFRYGKKGEYSKLVQCEELAYVYNYYHHHVFRRKVYQPFSENTKWLSNSDITVVQNHEFIPKIGGELLIIQSSFKDAMVMENLGYYSIAPITENCWFTEEYWNKLKSRWKNIIYYGNNDYTKSDNPGLKYCEYISNTYKIPYITNPDDTESDVSDYIKRYKFSETELMVKNLLKSVL